MNSKEQKRLMVLAKIDRGELKAGEAAAVVGLSLRQVRRLQRAYRKEGAAGLAHGNRGRRPSHALAVGVRAQVVALAQTVYTGCNDQHLSELLAERERLVVSRSTVRRWRRAAGLRSPRKRRRPAAHRARRERMPQEGMLLQIDGSPHAWLEDRGPRLTLVAAIDDATGKVVAARFRQQEDAQGYFLLFQDVLATAGIPLAVYHDRHTMFVHPPASRWSLEEELEGRPLPTHLARFFQETGIQAIAAHSPQAKGRIERLWGTLQDRLVAELRLAGATTPEEAQTVLQGYLPRFNARFAVPAVQPGHAYQPLPATLDLATVCCFKYIRTVGLDNTVRFGPHRLQVLPDASRSSYARARVEVHERLDGSLAVYYQDRCLLTTPAPAEAPVLRTRHSIRVPASRGDAWQDPPPPAAAVVGRWATPASPESAAVVPLSTTPRPGPNHPWRKTFKRVGVTKSQNN